MEMSVIEKVFIGSIIFVLIVVMVILILGFFHAVQAAEYTTTYEVDQEHTEPEATPTPTPTPTPVPTQANPPAPVVPSVAPEVLTFLEQILAQLQDESALAEISAQLAEAQAQTEEQANFLQDQIERLQESIGIPGQTPHRATFQPFTQYQTLGDMPIGSIVTIRENGVLTNFLVAHQGSPSPQYVGFNNGTILLRERVLPNRQMHTTNVNDYANSFMHTWLNSGYLNMLDEDIRNQMLQVRIPFRPGSGRSPTVDYGVNGLETRIFLLSMAEIGRSREGSHPYYEGSMLSLFLQGNGSEAIQRRIAQNDAGASTRWLLRTPSISNYASSWIITVLGDISMGNVNMQLGGPRPAFALPNTLHVLASGEIVIPPPSNGGDPGNGEGMLGLLTALLSQVEFQAVLMAEQLTALGEQSDLLFILLTFIAVLMSLWICEKIWRMIWYHCIQVWL